MTNSQPMRPREMMLSQTKRARRKYFTDASVKALPRRDKRYPVADPEMRGHYMRVPKSGPVVFVALTYDPYGKQKWVKLGDADILGIDEAREKAREVIKRIRAGQPAVEPLKPQPDSVETVAYAWLKRVVEKNKHITAPEKRRLIERYILPHPPFRGRSFVSIKRSEFATLFDHIEDRHGAHQAEQVKSVCSSIALWLAGRNDDYVVPFTRAMRRVPEAARKRSRFLSDDELRKVWQAAGDAGGFGAFVKLLLLTGQRRGALAGMKWTDIADDGTWTIPQAARQKGTIGIVRLPKLALDIVHAQPRFVGVDRIFDRIVNNIHRYKKEFDKASGVHGWQIHDLRRTARSLLSRAGIRPDISERVLGHTRRGVEGIYDHHPFTPEKGEALSKLAALIETILAGPHDGKNVVPGPGATRAAAAS